MLHFGVSHSTLKKKKRKQEKNLKKPSEAVYIKSTSNLY